MANKQRRTKEQVLQAIPGSGGIVTVIANKLGIARRTLFKYRQQWPDVEEAIITAAEEGLDFAESKLMAQVAKGDIRAIMFYLERKGRDRGWGAQQQINLQGTTPVQPLICFEDSSGGSSPEGLPNGSSEQH